MRMNPFPNENPENLAFAGDNFVRYSGDALALAQTQVLCWDMQEHGQNIDVISNPSQAELMKKQVVEKKKVIASSKQAAVLEKYGGGEHLQLDPRIKLGQTEAYVEYSWDGRIVKGVGKAVPTSKYEEDVFINNHLSVWGSYYNRHRRCWGYSCCHSLLKNSYCTGSAGREANDLANSIAMDPNQAKQMADNRKQSKTKDKVSSSASIVKRTDVYGESSGGALNEAALQESLRKEEEWKKRDFNKEGDDRRRSFNSMKSVDMSVEDMEAYRMKKSRREDPMASFVENESVIE